MLSVLNIYNPQSSTKVNDASYVMNVTGIYCKTIHSNNLVNFDFKIAHSL